ncbi:MAG: aldehyde dehydrogenase (NADP(+)), partial [Gemmatimonadales bacterium]
STNPVFVLPGALRERSAEMAAGYVQSVNLGVGQFCTNPGLMFVPESADLSAFLAAVAEEVRAVAPASMLHAGIRQAFVEGAGHVLATVGVDEVGASTGMADTAGAEVGGVIFRTDADTFERHPHLREEVFGPSSLVVVCSSAEAFETMARTLEGHLTATIHGTEADLEAHAGLIRILEDRVGRLNVNGFPTGVEVCAAMQHGGPYPATTDSRSTSVGTAALFRFARPICYQNFPEAALPEALREGNPLGIWRLVDGAWTQA